MALPMRKDPFGLVPHRGYEHCILKLTNRPLIQTGMDESFSTVMAEYKDANLDNFELLSKYWALCNGQYDILHEQWEGEVPSSWVAFSLMHEKNAIRLERDTWSLVRKLSECRAYNLPEGESLVPGFDSTVQELSDHLIQTQRDLQEVSIVLGWLEAISQDTDIIRQVKRDGKLQSMNGLEDEETVLNSRRDSIDYDPEATEDICKSIWLNLRRGLYENAATVAREGHQHWRAASLLGHIFPQDPGQDVGNPYHKLFRNTLRDILGNAKNMNPYERAIYGFQCLHLDAMLQVSSTWEDCLWAELRVFRDAKLLKEMSQYEYELVEDHSESLDISPPTLGDIFSNLNSPQSKVPREDTLTPYRMVQTLLILGNVGQLVKHLEMCAEEVAASFGEESKHSATPIWFLRFSVHLLIFLAKNYPITDDRNSIDQTASANIIKQYMKHLIHTDQGHLVAFYASFLPVDDSVEVYANFLSGITVYDKRLEYLQRAYLNGLDVLQITEKVVADIMQEPDHDRTDDFNYITQQDERRISALEWLLFNEEQHINAVWVANSVVRKFLLANKILAAVEVYNFLSPRLSKTIITMEHFPPQEYYRDLLSTNKLTQEDLEKAAVQVQIENIVREYRCLKDYLDAFTRYQEWDRVKVQALAGEDFQKNTELNTKTQAVVLMFQHILSAESPDPDRAESIQLTREKCIPNIFFLLHDVLLFSDVRQSLSLVTLVADEHYKLYECFKQEDLKHFLHRVRSSAIKLMEEEAGQKIRKLFT